MLKNIKIRHLNIIAFIILAYLFLPIWNDDLLYTWQEYSVFIKGSTFMAEMLREHGFFAWVGCYLTQFFYYPWLGSSMLIAIWVLSYYCLTDAFKLKDEFSTLALIPLVCLLISIVEVGYWIYYLDDPGYCFSNSVIFFISSAITWVLSKVSKPLLGMAFKGKALEIAVPILLVLCCEAIMAISGLRLDSFKRGSYESIAMAVPFIALRASIILLAIPYQALCTNPSNGSNPSDKTQSSIIVGLMCGVFATLGALTNIANVSDNNFHAEMKMYKAMDESRYEDVIAEAESAKGSPTNLMVLYKNIALLHTGRITDMFKTNNCGTQPKVDEAMNVRIAQISGEMVYYQLGQINYAYRWAIENSVKHGMTNARLKMLVRCATFNQEFEVAQKYITLLKATSFHRDWALERERMVFRANDFFSSREFQDISPVIDNATNYLDRDEGLCEKWILDHFSGLRYATNPKLESLIMCVSLWTEFDYAFLVHFYDYYQKHSSEAIPELYQEALIMLGNSEESPLTLNDFPFDSKISERYNSFLHDYQSLIQQGVKPEQAGARMKAQYGDTYWWYYYFYTDFNIY